MAYFAKIDENGIVIEVQSVANPTIEDSEGVEQESLGVDFLNNVHKTNDVWKQTSYNNNFRKQYAGPGYTYDAAKDIFISPQPHASWALDGNDDWQAPITRPTIYNDEADPVVWEWAFYWEESAYQGDNTKGWKATKRNVDNSVHEDTATYDWNGTSWEAS